ncbi:aminoglycoside phosphotransferase, partial [Alicyclobacillus cellulosilyticus]|uniref:aminoglycoside phosphotransferase n=1 Tax=Alicyclobacillus cellulosilyticus TaxID=1003997 RepID=UPI0016676665
TPASVHGASAAPAAPARPLALPRSWQAACARAGIPPSVLRRYAWEISEVRHLGTVIKVETDTGTFVVKETHLPPARVAFLAAAILHAQARGCLRTAAMVPARDGQPYAVADRRTFYATPFIAGAAANFASAYHVRQIAHTLAAWYEATRGFRHAGAPAPVGMEALLRRRADDLRRFADHAERKAEQDAFDELFLEWYPALRKDAEKSLSLLAEADVAAFLRSEMAAPGLCHLDVTPANFILAADGAYALDFDLAAYAPRALDAAHLIRRGLQASAWSADVAYACFVAYNEARAMSAAEYRLVEALLRFPYRAWRLASTRYTVFAEPAQVTELADAWREEPRRQAFLDAYREQIARLQRDA